MALTANTISNNMNAANTLNQKISDLMNKNSKTTNLNDLTKNLQDLGKNLLDGNSLLDKYLNNSNKQTNNKTDGITTISQAISQSANISILQASAKVSLNSGNSSQALFYQSVSARIEESLTYSFGLDDKGNEIFTFNYTQNIEFEYLQVAATSSNNIGNVSANNILANLNKNAETTANNLLKLTTSILDKFKEKNVSNFNQNINENTQKFIESVREGINKGFAETKGILESLKAYNENIETNLLKTMSLLEDGLNKLSTSTKK